MIVSRTMGSGASIDRVPFTHVDVLRVEEQRPLDASDLLNEAGEIDAGAAVAEVVRLRELLRSGNDEAMLEATLAPGLVDYLADLFMRNDADASGLLDADEFWVALSQDAHLRLTDDTIERLRSEADVDHDGNISWREFLSASHAIWAEPQFEEVDWESVKHDDAPEVAVGDGGAEAGEQVEGGAAWAASSEAGDDDAAAAACAEAEAALEEGGAEATEPAAEAMEPAAKTIEPAAEAEADASPKRGIKRVETSSVIDMVSMLDVQDTEAALAAAAETAAELAEEDAAAEAGAEAAPTEEDTVAEEATT